MMIYKFKKGQTVSLDSVYGILSLIPTDAYEQDDPAFWKDPGNDSGESIRFIADVQIRLDVKVTQP
jgi:hypothetical protein